MSNCAEDSAASFHIGLVSDSGMVWTQPIQVAKLHTHILVGHEIPTARKLIFKERLFASLLVVADKVRDMLNLQFMAISRWVRPHLVATELQLLQLTALKHLLYGYVPALFLVGM